jgi:uncharacterized protein with PQ loop repeat
MLKKVWDRDVRGVSIPFHGIQFVTATLWMIYGLGFVLGGLLSGLPLVIANVFIMGANVYVIQVTYRHQKENPVVNEITVVVEDSDENQS